MRLKRITIALTILILAVASILLIALRSMQAFLPEERAYVVGRQEGLHQPVDATDPSSQSGEHGGDRVDPPSVATGSDAKPIHRAEPWRVIDETGSPVPDAEVFLYLWRPYGELGRIAPHARDRTDASGRFSLPWYGSEFYIVAHKHTVGVGALDSRQLESSESPGSRDLVLLGSGELRGRVVYQNGLPVSCLFLATQPARFEHNERVLLLV